jgi:hypothetical protein
MTHKVLIFKDSELYYMDAIVFKSDLGPML